MSVCKSILYARKLLADFRLIFPQPCTILEDNMGMIALACGPQAHRQRTKHIDVQYHMQRKLVAAGIVRYQHQDTQFMFADALTKVLGKELHTRHSKVLFGMAPVVFKYGRFPESAHEYARRHNEELANIDKRKELKEAYSVLETSSQSDLLALAAALKHKRARRFSRRLLKAKQQKHE